MFPISLSINGLYSYKKKHTIKFDTLSEAGIFGIFGKVGSGKSSILEAITFAVFGKTDKLNISGDNRYYNMMNLDSDVVEISFEFLAGKEKEHFVCEFIAKRNSKKFDTVTNYNRRAAKKVGKEWQTIEFEEVEKAIGLSYDNFKRTVIIPQGQFAEFLQLKPAARIDMIKDIFSLQEYDLGESTRSLLKETKSQIELNENIISHQFEYLTDDFITIKKQELATLTKLIEEQEIQIHQKNEQKSQLEIIKTIFEEKNSKLNELQKLQAKEETIKQREANLNQFILIKNEFEDDLKDQKRLHTNLHSTIEQQKETQNNLQKATKSYDKAVEQQKEIVIQKEEISKKLEQIEPISQLIKLKEAQEKIKTNSDRIQKGTEIIAKTEEKSKEIKAEISKEKEKIAEFKSQIIDTENLQNAFIWLDKNETFSKNQSETHTEVELTKAEITKLETEKSDIEKNKLQLSENEITQKLEKISQEIEKLTMQKGLHQAVHSLEDGKPCPVCGSESHPNILDVKNIDSNLKSLKQQKKETEQDLKTLQKQEVELTRFVEKIAEKKQALEKQMQKQATAKAEFENHQKLFLEEWKNLSKNEILKIQKQQKDIQNQIKNAEKNLITSEQEAEKIIAEIEKYKTGIEKIKQEYASQTGQIKELERNSEKVSQTYADFLVSALEKVIVEIKQNAEKTEQAFLKNQEQEKQFFHQKSELEGTLKSIHSQFSSLNEEVENNQKQIEGKLEKLNQIAQKQRTQADIEAILKQNIDTDNERKEITTFFTNLKTTQTEYEKLEKQTEGKSYESDSFEKVVKEIKDLTAKQKQDSSQQTLILQDIKKAEKDTIEKEKLEQKQSKLLQRQDNLQTLTKLFKGGSGGFVDFASTEYLRNLCNLANIRFRELTHHSLELILNENNEFEIRDFLSEGKTRAIKTLSGGQLFQASLCVALALSESMRKQQEFFFIDEGFGSLDNDSLQIVLSTLQSLQKENKVVGIISHVESLQQEIRTHLHIQKNQTEGSLIKFIAG
ncbi:SbcC/MukB-like Walker B domain-containing protein [Bernardetia sp.]|uniref:SbcC/MukB-like Walker B domain-containing protein n=1 Tax=Bernardetia sp. TaxID=1937974 RepID=UPI0025BD8BD6|nr:SbcC/MukB-like Walker B domain-containing protein [Bernardetia sp.]